MWCLITELVAIVAQLAWTLAEGSQHLQDNFSARCTVTFFRQLMDWYRTGMIKRETIRFNCRR
jgi:hypothetical protein